MILPPTRKSPDRKTGAIYARYSSRFQHSIEDQIRVCKDWAEKNGITVPDELIFVDRAVTGKSCRRQGLKDFQQALAENRAHVAIMFTTNRLYRKFYQSLAFVEEEIVDKGKRAVFVKSGPIDTDDKEHWRQLLHIHALMDEFVIQTVAAHVQSAHEGLLLQCRVFGTVAFGFTGEVIPGQLTRLGRPARRLIIDPEAAEWVKKVFEWFIV
jgi:site-specific DNA recombinase